MIDCLKGKELILNKPGKKSMKGGKRKNGTYFERNLALCKLWIDYYFKRGGNWLWIKKKSWRF